MRSRTSSGTLADGFLKAHERWPTGSYALWYPVKDIGSVKNFHKRLYESGVERLLAAELWVRERSTPDRFNGTGLVLCNPPWKLEQALQTLLRGLAPLLGEDDAAGSQVWWIRGEEPPPGLTPRASRRALRGYLPPPRSERVDLVRPQGAQESRPSIPGASKSISGPTGTMPVGLIILWLS